MVDLVVLIVCVFSGGRSAGARDVSFFSPRAEATFE
jgi:hypothetical protein